MYVCTVHTISLTVYPAPYPQSNSSQSGCVASEVVCHRAFHCRLYCLCLRAGQNPMTKRPTSPEGLATSTRFPHSHHCYDSPFPAPPLVSHMGSVAV